MGSFFEITKTGDFLTRREEREQAFILLFEQAIQDKTAEEVFQDAADARDFQLGSFTKQLVLGAQENREQVDTVISENIKGWNIKRISKVTLAILRLAVYELLREASIPVSVTINEAVELAKIYGSKDDAPYINGVLSSVEKMAAYQKNAE